MALRVLAFVVIALGIGAAINDVAIGWFVSVAVAGGAIGAVIMIAIGRRQHQAPLVVPDAFARATPEGIMNISRIRVAGLGGLGMVAMAVAVGFMIPGIGLSLALGLVGGFLIAVALVPYRRRHAGQRP